MRVLEGLSVGIFLLFSVFCSSIRSWSFLDAFSHLYKRVCPSIRMSVGHASVETWLSSIFFALIGYFKGCRVSRGYMVWSIDLVTAKNQDNNMQIRFQVPPIENASSVPLRYLLWIAIAIHLNMTWFFFVNSDSNAHCTMGFWFWFCFVFVSGAIGFGSLYIVFS